VLIFFLKIFFHNNADFELDLHRPHIDAVKLACSCGGTMSRVREVMDVWFDSGAMPFAQDHYPFDTPRTGIFKRQVFPYPADFISEAGGLFQIRCRLSGCHDYRITPVG
jgi:isoleucyl-tRNA synthetase